MLIVGKLVLNVFKKEKYIVDLVFNFAVIVGFGFVMIVVVLVI